MTTSQLIETKIIQQILFVNVIKNKWDEKYLKIKIKKIINKEVYYHHLLTSFSIITQSIVGEQQNCIELLISL